MPLQLSDKVRALGDQAQRELAVSYTHLDVYKRQDGPFAPSARLSSLLDWSIIQENGVYVKWFPGLETSKHMEPLTVSIEFFCPVC